MNNLITFAFNVMVTAIYLGPVIAASYIGYLEFSLWLDRSTSND